jgi:hypothetical protein
MPPTDLWSGHGDDCLVNPVKSIWPWIYRWITKIPMLPRAIAGFVGERHRQVVLNELEAERLDRIRNPVKYRGR